MVSKKNLLLQDPVSGAMLVFRRVFPCFCQLQPPVPQHPKGPHPPQTEEHSGTDLMQNFRLLGKAEDLSVELTLGSHFSIEKTCRKNGLISIDTLHTVFFHKIRALVFFEMSSNPIAGMVAICRRNSETWGHRNQTWNTKKKRWKYLQGTKISYLRKGKSSSKVLW